MPEQAPTFSGPDILGGPDFDLADHKGSFVFVAFMGLPWCGPCKLELPHLQTLAGSYAVNPSVPVVTFVIVNNKGPHQNSGIVAYAKQENVTIPIIDDANNAIFSAYPNIGGVPTSVIVKPSGELCDDRLVGAHATDELLGLLLACGAPSPGGVQAPPIPRIDWGSQPPETISTTPVGIFLGYPIKDPPVPVDPDPFPPRPYRMVGLDHMSREVVRALAIHDGAANLVDHETRTAIRSSALKAAAAGLRRMESLAELEGQLGPLPPHAFERLRDDEGTGRR
jgi:thiol-disulfide isomerase/thioredoxin